MIKKTGSTALFWCTDFWPKRTRWLIDSRTRMPCTNCCVYSCQGVCPLPSSCKQRARCRLWHNVCSVLDHWIIQFQLHWKFKSASLLRSDVSRKFDAETCTFLPLLRCACSTQSSCRRILLCVFVLLSAWPPCGRSALLPYARWRQQQCTGQGVLQHPPPSHCWSSTGRISQKNNLFKVSRPTGVCLFDHADALWLCCLSLWCKKALRVHGTLLVRFICCWRHKRKLVGNDIIMTVAGSATYVQTNIMRCLLAAVLRKLTWKKSNLQNIQSLVWWNCTLRSVIPLSAHFRFVVCVENNGVKV